MSQMENPSYDPNPIDNSEHLKFYHFLSEDFQESVNASVNYFTNLFKCPIGEIRLFLKDLPSSRRPYFFGYKKFGKLRVEGDQPLENDELRELIANVEIDKYMYLDIPVHPDFHCDSSHLQMEGIRLGYDSGGWITRDILFSLKSTFLLMLGCDFSKLTPKDCMEFVDRWYHSEDNNFKIMTIQWTDYLGSVDLEKYNPVKWDRRRRSQYYPVFPGIAWNFENGMDIQRQDGTWATIEAIDHTLFFCVWHEMFPNLEEYEIL